MAKTPLYKENYPLNVLNTPKFKTGKTDSFTMEGSNMTLSHNSFIRGFNSIYQQATRVPQADKQDFIGYCIAWWDCIAQHHHYEETDFFPAIDAATGQKGLMDGAVEQHAAFHDGLQSFKTYLTEKGESFDGEELIKIMDSFSQILYDHLQAEPDQIAALAKWDSAEKPIDIVGIALAAGKKQVSGGFLVNILPVFFLNMEFDEFEGGMWKGVFPDVNMPTKWIMMKGAPMWHGQRRWRFSSCTADGAFNHLAV